jgi:hypothetical protein
VMPDGGLGEAHFAAHPALRTAELDGEMLAVAEARLAAVEPDGARKYRLQFSIIIVYNAP